MGTNPLDFATDHDLGAYIAFACESHTVSIKVTPAPQCSRNSANFLADPNKKKSAILPPLKNRAENFKFSKMKKIFAQF